MKHRLNHRLTRSRLTRSAVLGLAALSAVGYLAVGRSSAQPADSGSADSAIAASLIEKGVTQPSLRKELSFAEIGIIAKVSVKDGDVIHSGQELMRQYDKTS